MTGNKAVVGLIVSVLAGATLTSVAVAAPSDALVPEAVELEDRPAALRRGAAELTKLRALGIKTLTQMAQADARKVATVVGTDRAKALIAQSKHATRATGIIALDWIIDPSYVVNPAFIIDPSYRTGSRVAQQRATGAAELTSLKTKGVATFAALLASRNKMKIVSVVGARRAEGLIKGAQKAVNDGIIDPSYTVGPTFIVDPMIITTRN